jgi:UDP-glucuronate 4-epimerase
MNGDLMRMKETTVFVTGAAGFIGSHLCELLLDEGMFVVGLDNMNDYYDPKLKEYNVQLLSSKKQFEFIEGDIRDEDLLSSIFKKWKISSIVHLAAMVGVRNSIQFPEEYVDVNIGGLTNVLEESAKNNVGHFVYASSSSVYGNRTAVPFKEDDSTDFPYSPYAATKKAGEVLVYAYHSLYNMPATCLRFFTVYGPRGRPDMAPFKFIDRISRGIPIQQYGDGSSARDYTFVGDLVKGIFSAIEKPQGYEIYNLGGSRTIRLADFIRTVETVVEKKAIIEVIEEQPGDVTLTYADISKAKRDLSYSPSVDFEEGLKITAEWYRSYGA